LSSAAAGFGRTTTAFWRTSARSQVVVTTKDVVGGTGHYLNRSVGLETNVLRLLQAASARVEA
jgi:hypothetical protein